MERGELLWFLDRLAAVGKYGTEHYAVYAGRARDINKISTKDIKKQFGETRTPEATVIRHNETLECCL